MLLVWVLTLILSSCGYEPAVLLATWFGEHVLGTILLILFFA